MTKERIVESNRVNSKDHAHERNLRPSDRPERQVNRDVEIVKLSDGREFVRNPRTSLSRQGRFNLPKKPGYIRRWVSTSSNAPHSIQDLVDLGYNQCTDENGNQIAPRKGGTERGEEFKLIPMEISEEMNAKIERDNKIKAMNKQQEVLDKMRGNDLGSGSFTYVGHDSQKSVTKQN